MKNMSRIEAGVLATDYREQAQRIRDGKRSTGFAYAHGRTVGKMLGAIIPNIFQVPGILLSDERTLQKKYRNNEAFINEWGRIDGSLRDLRRSWSINEKTAMFLGVLLHGGVIATVAQSVNVDSMFKFNRGMDAIDRTLGNAASKASRVISGPRKTGKK